MKTMKLVVFFVLITLSAGAQTLKEAIRYSDREQYQKAKEILKGLVKTDTKSTDQYYYLGDIYFKNEQYDSARYWFMEAVKINENSALNYVGLGKVSMEKNATEGKANFDKAMSLAKKDGRIAASIAEYYLNLDKPDRAKALEYALKGVETDPKNPWAKLILGDAYLASADGTKAMEQYKAAIALEPKSPAPLWKVGKLYLAAKNYEVGIQSFKDGLVHDSLYSPIYRDLGELYYKAGKYEKAIQTYKKYLEIRDKSDMTDFRYASFLYLNQDYANAMSILTNLAKKNYDNPTIYRIMAYSQLETKDFAGAQQNMDIFWKKVEAKKIITQDYENYGRILVKLGKDSLGVDYLNKALEKDTSRKEIYGEIANIWFAARKYDKAAAAFKRKIEMTQGTARSSALANDYLNMGKAYLNNKNYAEADQAFSKLIELRPDLPVGYLYRAKTNALIDLPKQEKGLAKPYYEKYIELAKADPEKNKNELIDAYSYLGSYYLVVVKDKVKYEEAWNNVKALDPTNKKANDALKGQ
jgi:tetratricopeptide (TPR) repeat protein